MCWHELEGHIEFKISGSIAPVTQKTDSFYGNPLKSSGERCWGPYKGISGHEIATCDNPGARLQPKVGAPKRKMTQSML